MTGNGAATDYANLTPHQKRQAAIAAPRVSSAFLKGLPERLGMQIKPFCKALGIADPTFYAYVNSGECPDYIRAKAEELAAEKGITLAPAAAVKSKSKKVVRTPRAEMVPAGFLDGIEEKLGIPQHQLCELLGVKQHSFQQYRVRGRAPLGLRTAINGLLAERKLQNGELTERKPKPAKRGRPPAVIQAAEAVQRGDIVVLHIMVPRDQMSVASAMLAACGYPFQISKGE